MEPAHEQSILTQATTPNGGNPRAGHGPRSRTLPLYILTFLILAAAVVGFVRYDLSAAYRNSLAYWEARQSTVADNRARRISIWLGERQEDAQLVAAHPLVRAALGARHASHRAGVARRQGLSELTAALDHVVTLYPYAGIYVLDRDARVVAQASHSAPLDPSLADACKAAAAAGDLRIAVRGEAPQRTVIAFVAPVYPGTPPDSSGQPSPPALGVVLTLADAAGTLFDLAIRESVATRTGETVLVRREGNDLVSFAPSRSAPTGSLNRRCPLSAAPLPARLALEGRETIIECNDYRGVPVLAATRRIPPAGWGMVCKIDRGEVMADFRRQVKVEMWAAVLLVILLGALLLLHRHAVVGAVLKEEGAKFRALFELAPDAIYMIEPSTLHILARNRKGAEMDGYSDAEVARMTMADLHPPEERHLLRQRLANTPESGVASPTQTLHIVRKDGRLVPIEESQGLVDAGGQRFRLSFARDVTERKRAVEALAESEGRFRSLVENATVGVYRTTPNGSILMANPTLVRMLRFDSFEELASRNLELEGFAAGYPRSSFREQIEREGEVSGFESVWERHDRTVLFVRESARIVRAGDGRVLYYDGIVEDFTERKRADEALKESEARFRAVFENAAIGIALVDMHGHPLQRNRALLKMLGYDKTEPVQLAFNEFTPPADSEADWDLFTELVEGERDQYQLEKRFRRKDGKVIWGELTVSLVRDQTGGPRYAIGMVRDTSERRQAEEALRRLSGRLLRLQDEERRRIARDLHDTTAQSLAALATNLSMVKDAASSLSPRAQACLSESFELAEQCFREIRTLSYLLHPPLLEEAGLGSALRWFVDGYTQRTGIHVDLETPPEPTRLPSEIELALFRVVQEALTNIHLHSGSKKAQVSLKCRPDQATLTVADEGRGIISDVMEGRGKKSAKLGVGIPGMRERIRELGGQFEILTGKNGTTLVAIVPLKGEHV